MAAIFEPRLRPLASADHRAPSRPRTWGLVIAVVGLTLTAIAFVASLVVSGDGAERASTLPWAFGLTTLGFGTVKLSIAVVLWGILMKLWLRVDSIKDALRSLIGKGVGVEGEGGQVDLGSYSVSKTAPEDLSIHKMAKKMWRPMLAMGYMAVVIGFAISLSWATNGSAVASAWTQGLQFLGEGMLLAGISFLLGTILWAIRTGGGEVQEGLGVEVRTLKMPLTGKLFVGLMILGLMVSVAQFVGYLIVAGGGVNTAAWTSFLGPLREIGLALILLGVTMALITISNALAFQFQRVQQIIAAGR